MATETPSSAAGPVIGIRAEGVTEQLPPLYISGCTGTTDTSSITVTVQSSAPFTNAGMTGGASGTTDAFAQMTATSGTFNAFGVATSASTMVFTFTTSTGNGTLTAGSGVTGILVSNLRINATGSPAGTTFTLNAFGTNGVTITQTSAVSAAISQTSLGAVTFTGYTNLAICQIGSKDLDAVGTIGIKDNFIGAFTTDTQEFQKEPSVVTGTTNPITLATTVGSRIALNFTNLATAGVVYYLPLSVTNNGLSLELVSSPSCATGGQSNSSCFLTAGSTLGGSGSSYQNVNSGGTSPTAQSVPGLVSFTPTNGSFTAYYAVVADNDSMPGFNMTGSSPGLPFSGSMTLPTVITLYETVASSTAVSAPSVAPSVTVSLAGQASPYYAEFVTPASAAPVSAVLSKAPAGELSLCNTTLLFPYLLTFAGYDTGIAIDNAGVGTSVIGNSVTSTTSGACTLTLYGSATINGTALSAPIAIPLTIAAGQVNAMNLSMLLPSTTPTFVGYGVASCSFQGAHAFAQISNPSLGFSEGYLGVVLAQVTGGSYNFTTDQF
jgi:hypothetical protein